jgi:hypothetical protein
MAHTKYPTTAPVKHILMALTVIVIFALTACQGVQTPTPAPSPAATATQAQSTAASPTASLPAPTFTPLPPSDGPFLLIQTDYDAYEIIDFTLDQHYPLDLPDVDQRIGLGGALSSSRTQLMLPIQDGQVQIFDLTTGTIQTVAIPRAGFDPDQTADLAQAALSEMGLSDEAVLSAVESSFNNSVSQVRWGLDDEHLLVVVPGSPTSTNLATVEIASGEVETLETLPGMIEKISRYGEMALLKKGSITEPGYWRDDQYAVLNLSTGEAQPIDLPADAQNPILAWYGASTLSIIHQSQPVGGVDFSLLNLEDMTNQLVIEGQFSAIRPYQQGLLVFKPEPDSTQTIVERRDAAGDLIDETLLPEQCTLNLIVQDKVVLNCETESLLMDSDLTTTTFSGPIFQLISSPDGGTWVLVERSGQTSLLDSALANPQPITLEGAPLEVRWLPDSDRFLYRTLGQLYLYDPASDQSTLLLESDLLGDYANINAVWITIPD